MGKSQEERLHKMKRFVCLFIVCFLTGSLVFHSTANQLSEFQKNLEQTESKASATKKKIEQKEKDISWNKQKRDSLIKEMEAMGLQKEEIEQQVQLLESALQSLDDAIEQAEREYEEQLELLKGRLRAMYKKSATVWELDELFKSRNLNELIYRIRLMKLITENDQRLLDGVEAKRLEIEDLKEQKQFEMDNAIEQIKQYTEQIQELDVSRSTLEQEIKSDQKTLKQYEADEAQLAKESKEWESLIKKWQSTGGKFVGRLTWPMPTNKNIYSYYGNRLHPIYKVWKMHTGIDIGSAWNESIVAAGDGVVIYAGTRGGYGNCVIIDHGGGISTLYAHINTRGILVKTGQAVTSGQKIAKAGMSGTATGPHLHFEVRKDGSTQNPLDYVEEPKK